MAATYTFSGGMEISASGSDAVSGDWAGSITASLARSITFAATGGTAPTISGYLRGTAVAAAGDWLLAHASDPLQGMGDAAYAPGFTVASSKLKLLIVANDDVTNTVTIVRGATNGLAIFAAAGDGVILTAGGILVFYDPTGAQSGTLTTGTNDKLTIAIGGGTPAVSVLAFYGP